MRPEFEDKALITASDSSLYYLAGATKLDTSNVTTDVFDDGIKLEKSGRNTPSNSRIPPSAKIIVLLEYDI